MMFIDFKGSGLMLSNLMLTNQIYSINDIIELIQ